MSDKTSQPEEIVIDEISGLSDEELLAEARSARILLLQLIADGDETDPNKLAMFDAAIEHYEQSIEAEKQAFEAVRISGERLARSADALLAASLTEDLKPFYPGLKPLPKPKGN